jgi:Trk K+ transport system NAD-binding subunit
LVRRLGLATEAPAWQSVAEALPVDVADIDLIEVEVTSDLAIAGKPLRDHPPGPGILVIALLRDGETHVPTGETTISSGDVLVLSIDDASVELTDVTAWARGEEKGPEA